MSVDLLSVGWAAADGERPGDRDGAGRAGPDLPGGAEGFEGFYAGPDGGEVRAGLDQLGGADLERCYPVRSFPSYKGQQNYPG